MKNRNIALILILILLGVVSVIWFTLRTKSGKNKDLYFHTTGGSEPASILVTESASEDGREIVVNFASGTDMVCQVTFDGKSANCVVSTKEGIKPNKTITVTKTKDNQLRTVVMTIDNGGAQMIMDRDGDGLPEQLNTETTRYRLKIEKEEEAKKGGK
jgi:hypothetical protein